MADIKQAAKWMLRNKKVRRKSEPDEIFDASTYFGGAVFVSRCEQVSVFARMKLAQLLADDWEIAE